MALNTDVPQWLVQQNMWEQQDASASVRSLVGDYFEGQKLGMEKQQQQINLQSGLLGLQQQKQVLALNDVKLRNQTVDSTVIPNWLKDHPTWQSRQDAGGYPTALTPEWETKIDKVRIADTQSVQQRVVLSGVSEFTKRVNDLSKSDPIAGSQFAPYIGKVPPPVVLQALGVAEQAMGVRQQNEKDQAALDAQSRGDVATTTINDKGVSTSYKPAPANSGTSQFKPEQPISLQGGAQLIHVSPNRWQYVKGDTKTDLTPDQKRNIAREILALDAKDPRGLKILDELAGMATKSDKTTDVPNAMKIGRFTVTPQ